MYLWALYIVWFSRTECSYTPSQSISCLGSASKLSSCPRSAETVDEVLRAFLVMTIVLPRNNPARTCKQNPLPPEKHKPALHLFYKTFDFVFSCLLLGPVCKKVRLQAEHPM